MMATLQVFSTYVRGPDIGDPLVPDCVTKAGLTAYQIVGATRNPQPGDPVFITAPFTARQKAALVADSNHGSESIVLDTSTSTAQLGQIATADLTAFRAQAAKLGITTAQVTALLGTIAVGDPIARFRDIVDAMRNMGTHETSHRK